ncbi:MAG: TolC family protein [Verrucomicrobia bacterium]|nr:TolC family protein [Verrucomicrobiota bacterium]
MRSLVLVSLLLAIGLPITAAITNAVPLPSGPLTLDQALEFALTHNVTLRKGRQDLEEAQGLAIQQRAVRLPRLAATGAYQQLDEARIERVQFSAAQPATPFLNNQSWNANLVVTQPIYAGGKYNSMARSSRLTREAALASYQALVANTLLEVRTAYSDVLLAVEQIVVQEASKKLLERELETARRSLEAGTVPRFNVLRAEVELANALPPLIRARNQERISRNTLALLLGCDIPADSGVDIPLRTADSLKAEPFEVSVGAALNAAWLRRPEIKAAQSTSQLRHEEVLQTRADLLPSLSGTAGYGVQNRNFIRDLDQTLDGWTVGVQANWLLFDFGQTQAKVNMARAREERARLEVEDVRRRIELEVRTAFSLFMESKEVLVSQTRVIEQAEEAVRLVTARADAGSSTQLEVLSAQTALKLSRTQYSQALRDYTVARAKLERAMGEGVRLVIETGGR